MRSDDGELHLLNRATGTGTGGACPSPDDLVRTILGQLEPAERGRIVAHLVQCEDCSCELRLIRTLRPWAESAAAGLESAGLPAGGRPAGPRLVWAAPPPAAAAAVSASRRRAAALLLAACVALAAGLDLQQWGRLAAPEADTHRTAILPAGVAPRDGATLRTAPERFTWDSAAPAGPARLVLYDGAMNRLWESPALAQSWAELPPEVRGRLQPGRRYYWAVMPAGASRSHGSPLHRFELEP
jgi:hypothetical protein